MSSGALSLGSNTVNISGPSYFNGGSVTGGNISINNDSTTFTSSTIGSSINLTSEDIYLNGGVFNGPVSFTKTGSNSDIGFGGNTFNSTFSLTNTGTGNISLAETNPDHFNGDITLNDITTGYISVADASAGNTFTGNITINGAAYFGLNQGSIILNGPSNQTFTGGEVAVANMQINKPSGNVQLNNISFNCILLNLTQGIVFTNGNPFVFLDALGLVANASGGNNSSYIDGQIIKTGNDPFTFPTGNNGDYQPISISAPASGSDFAAQYFAAGQTLGNTTDPTITGLSTCEYWNLNRTTGTDNVSVTLGWNSSSCDVTSNISNMLLAGWNGTDWANLGGINPTGTHTNGMITSTSPLSTYGPITLANTLPCNVIANAGSNVTLCAGASAVLSASGGNTYSWSPSVGLSSTTIANPIANPTSTTTYTVTVSTSSGCSATATVMVSLSATVAPTIKAKTSATTTCIGTAVTLTASGGTTYSWSTGATSPTISVSQNSTTTYTVTGTASDGCSNISTVTEIIKTVNANANHTIVCAGTSVKLTGGGGASSYSWTAGVTDGTVFVPTATQTYTVTGTFTSGCTNTSTVTVTVNPLPTVSANSNVSALCKGSGTNVTLSGSGSAVSYSWTGGVTDGVAFAPTATKTYTVTGTDGNNCQNTSAATITVNPLPAITVVPHDSTICAGNSITFTASGAVSYSWTGGLANGVLFTPSVTTSYTVTGTDANGCQNTATDKITVHPLPIVYAHASAATIDAGTSVTLHGSGAQSYVWTDGLTDGVAFIPDSTNSYTVTGTDSHGCSSSSSVIVNVIPFGSMCATAIQIGDSFPFIYWDQKSINDTLWYSFIAMDTSMIISANTGKPMDFNVINVFKGTCNSLKLLNTGSYKLLVNGLVLNTKYYIQVISRQGNSFYFYGNVPPSTQSTCAAPTLTCGNQIANTDFSSITGTYDVNSTGPGSYKSGSHNCFNHSEPGIYSSTFWECYWQGWAGQPYVMPGGVSGSGIPALYAEIWGDNGDGNAAAIEQDVSVIQNQKYILDYYLLYEPSAPILIGVPGPIAPAQNFYAFLSSSLNVKPGFGSFNLDPTMFPSLIISDQTNFSNSSTWQHIHTCFTADQNYDELVMDALSIIPPVSGNTIETNFAYGIDNVSLQLFQPNIVGPNVVSCSPVQLGDPSCPDLPNTTYSWSPGTNLNHANISNPTAVPTAGGITYTVTISDNASGCTNTATVTVIRGAVPASIAGASDICYNGSDYLVASPSGSGYTYTWSTGSNSQAIVVGPLINSASYAVTVTDGTGCTGTSSIAVTVDSPISITSTNQIFCSSQQASLSATATGGTGLYTATWNPGNIVLSGAPFNTAITQTAALKTYTLTVTDEFGCSSTATETVTINTSPAMPVITGATTTCVGSAGFVYTASNLPPVNSGNTVTWNVTTGNQSQHFQSYTNHNSGQSSIEVFWNTNGSYGQLVGIVSITVTGSDGCSTIATLQVSPCCFNPNEVNACSDLNEVSVTTYTICTGSQAIISQPTPGPGNPYVLESPTGAPIYINGTLTVDANLTIQNNLSAGANLHMGGNSKILVKSPNKLTIQTTQAPTTILRAGCDYMWDGIYVEPGASLIIENITGNGYSGTQAIIQDAVNGIVLMNGASISNCTINNAEFLNDYVGMQVDKYSASIVNNPITESRFIGSTLLIIPPKVGQASSTGIRITDVNYFNGASTYGGITIGDQINPLNINTFTQLDTGISAIRSNVTVYNSNFNGGAGLYGIGIASFSPLKNPPAELTVQYYLPNPLNPPVTNNTFVNNFFGIKAVNNGGLTVNGTFMSNVGTGISSTNNTASLQYNIISNPFVGIIANNVNHLHYHVLISDNTVSDPVEGIFVTNLDGSAPTQSSSRIDSNAVYWSPTSPLATGSYPAGLYFGIYLQNSTKVFVDNNKVDVEGTTFVPSSSTSANVYGIYVENSPFSYVAFNNLTNLGTGIVNSGQSPNSQFACNKMVNCYYGIDFTGTGGFSTVGDQLSGIIPQGNTWTGTVSPYNCFGNIKPPIHFYWNGTVGSPSDPGNNLGMVGGSLLGVGNTFENTTNPDNCSNGTYPEFKMRASAASLKRDQQFKAIVSNLDTFPMYNSQTYYSNKQYAYRYFKTNPGQLSLGLGDSLYQAFYDSMSAIAVGKFEIVNDLIDSGNVSAASVMNATIPVASQLDANRQIVNNIYLNTWQSGIYKFDSTQYNTLYNIAVQDPLLASDAVYSARVLLGLNFFNGGNYSGAKMREAAKKTTALAPPLGKLYPNPNDGNMQFDYSLASGSTGDFIIFTLSGIKIADYRLGEGDNATLRINEAGLSNGLYFYTEIVNGAVVTTGKLVIIK